MTTLMMIEEEKRRKSFYSAQCNLKCILLWNKMPFLTLFRNKEKPLRINFLVKKSTRGIKCHIYTNQFHIGYWLYWFRNLKKHLKFTCIALFPSFTTSNKVTGSPSPFCWGCPLALPRPVPLTPASILLFSPGDLRGFLFVD